MHRRLYPALLCLALIGCDSAPVSLGDRSGAGGAAGSGGVGGTAGESGSSGAGDGGQGGSGGLPVAQACGPSICVDGTACCSESCGLCTLGGRVPRGRVRERPGPVRRGRLPRTCAARAPTSCARTAAWRARSASATAPAIAAGRFGTARRLAPAIPAARAADWSAPTRNTAATRRAPSAA